MTARRVPLQILLGARIGEIVGMRWGEIDTTARLWTLPAERAKNAIVHTTLLTDTVLEILEEERLRRDGDDPHVLPARTGNAEIIKTKRVWSRFRQEFQERLIMSKWFSTDDPVC